MFHKLVHIFAAWVFGVMFGIVIAGVIYHDGSYIQTEDAGEYYHR